MPPGQGQSTMRKEAGLSGLCRMALRVSKTERLARYNYWHIDLNAGPGYNNIASCDGSPLIFLKEAILVQRPVRAFFCESDQACCAALRSRLTNIPPGSWVEVLEMDNAAALPLVADDVRRLESNPQHALGTCICDPNGFRKGFPVAELVTFFNEFPRIDFILNLNVSVLRRGLGARDSYLTDPANSRPCFKGFRDWPELGELLGRFNKKHWMLRSPPRINTDQFITAFGHNGRKNYRPFLSFYPLESPQGQEMLRTLAPLRTGQLYLPGLE